MPTYSYRCTDCDNAFDIHQAFTDESLTECPVCAGRLRKVFGTVGVSFTGSGFYRNDSRAPQKSESESGSGSKESGSKDSGSKGSDSKGSDSKGSDSKGSGSGSRDSGGASTGKSGATPVTSSSDGGSKSVSASSTSKG